MNFYQLATYSNKYAKLAMIVGIILLSTQILVSFLSVGWFWFLFLYCVGLYLGLSAATYMFIDAGTQSIDDDDKKHFMIFGGILVIPYLTAVAGIVYTVFAVKALLDDNDSMESFKDAYMCRFEMPEEESEETSN